MLDTLLELYFFPNTTVTTYVWALCTLQAAHKKHLVGWCARAMCLNQYNPKQVINYLALLCPTDMEPKELISKNLHHLLPLSSSSQSAQATPAPMGQIPP